MNAQQSALGNLLADVAKAVRGLSDDEFEKRGSGGKSRKLSPAVSEEELRNIQMKLDAAQTRDEGYCIVKEAFPLKESLFAFARFLDLPVEKKDKIERMQDKIVAFTVGRRLNSEAIRGGYSAT